MIKEMDKETTAEEVEEAQILNGELSAEEVSLEISQEAVEEESKATSDDTSEMVPEEGSDEGLVAVVDEEDSVEIATEDMEDEEVGTIILDEEVDTLEEVAPFEDDGRAWYVVHCYSGYENKVRHSIEQRIETMGMQDKIFDVVVPTEEEIEIKDGKRRTVERRVFPGYILVQLIMGEDSWYVVRNTPGVTGFVGMGNEPTPLREDEVAKIMNRMEAEAPKVKFNFQPGEKVRIRTGPFADFIGTVDEIDIERAKVRVLVSFFGRETPVELDFLHVENV
jgi:transcriptional antiterminator NusG